MIDLPAALAAFANYRQFILWTTELRNGKLIKLPIDYRTAKKASVDDPNSWTDATTAINTAKLYGENYGVGFVFTQDDPFFFVDIDKCRVDVNSPWSDTANAVLSYFPGAAVEVSQSGTGLHIFGMGNAPKHACKNIPLGLEFYTEGRFVALTGRDIIGDAGTTHNEWLPNFVINYVPERVAVSPEQWTTGPVPEWNGPEDDDELINKALQSASAAGTFGSRATFADLWERNVEVLAAMWQPDASDGGEYDESAADMALIQHLAFWTGKDCERMLRIVWQSGLVRDKWTHHKDYLRMSIMRSVSLQKDVYGSQLTEVDKTLVNEFDAPALKGSPKQKLYAENIRAQKLIDCLGDVTTIEKLTARRGPVVEAGFWMDNSDKTPEQLIEIITPVENASDPMGTDDEPEYLTGLQFLHRDQQIELFTGCVYIADLHKIFTPSGSFYKSEQFNAIYGGYTFAMDDSGKKETRKAWEAFTESQLVRYRKADTTCFRPDLEPGAFVDIEGKTAVNIYVPVKTKRVHGDITPFLIHLCKILPNEADRAILLAYMAACIQHKGVKFQWAPLLQGVQGNGKTLFTRCVAFAIGEKFTHKPPAEQITEKYNEWLYGTLFIGVEDIYVPDHKINMIEILKPMITDDRQAIRGMGVAQLMKTICCNFMFNSNHKDAIRLTINDRRYAVFYAAQQNYADLERDGMNGDYFPNLYKWLKNEDGYAMVAEYLENYAIPANLNPAIDCHRAPTTSSTNEAITASMGGVEQEIIEAIEQGRPGFAGGWISSIALEHLLNDMGMKRSIPQNKRKQMLNDMGYEWHPALNKGRVNNHIMCDQGKPKLYLKAGHVSLNLQTAAEVAKAYETAQNGQVVTGHGGRDGSVFRT